MKVLSKVFILVLLLGFTPHAFTQINSAVENQAQEILKEKDISEEEVKAKLIERGYDPENITPEQLPQYQGVLEEIIAEIEREKNKENTGGTTDTVVSNDQATDIEPGVEKVVINNKGLSQEEEKVEKEAENQIDSLPDTKVNIYGHELFSNKEIGLFRTVDNFTPPDNYVLSSGDVIKISIFGASQADLEYTIDQAGDITATNVGKVYLKGLTVAKAKDVLRKRFERSYRFLPEQFSLTLKTARTVTINIFGEVPIPGSYTISAINTAINALMASGGVSKNGSVRNIKLIKSSGETKVIDIYDFMLNPQNKYEYSLDNQDVIYVPLADNIVSIEGGIKRPMRYELLPSETIQDIVALAGGFTNKANQDLLSVSRVLGDERTVLDVNFASSFNLKDGDLVTVKIAKETGRKYVGVSGEVVYPGEYEYKEGITLQSIIDKAKFTELTRPDLVFIFRSKLDGTIGLEKYDITETSPNGIILNVRDRVQFISIKSYVDETKTVSISGAVRQPNEYRFDPEERIRVSDLILLSGGLTLNANPEAILRRKNPENNEEIEYLKVNVFNAISDQMAEENILLKEGDVLTIYNNERYNNMGNVYIEGEVRNPDTLQYDPSLTLDAVLLAAGGLKENANNIAIIKRFALDNSKEVEYIRIDLQEENRDLELQRGDIVRVYDKSVFMDQYDIQIYGEVKSPGSFQFDESLNIQDIIYMAGGLTLKASTNKVEIYRVDFSEDNPTKVLVKEIDLRINANDEIVPTEPIQLEPFDIIIVRPVPDFELQEIVYVNGEVPYPGPYILSKKDEKLKDLIKRAGGLQYDAFADGATLLRKRGDKAGKIFINLADVMNSGNNHENIVMRAGDVLFIPKKENIVSIVTRATRASKEYTETMLVDNKIQVAYQGKRSAKWYVNNFAGGFDREIDKKSVRVLEPNGRIRGTKRYLGFIYNYPTVVEGGTIAMDYKPPPPPEKERKPIDWGKTITDVMAVVSSAVTIIVLVNQLNKE